MPDLAHIAMLMVSVVLAHGANARIARLIAEDEITEPMRAWLIRHNRYKTWTLLRLWPTQKRIQFNRDLIWKWAECPWCCGFWTAWPVTAIAWFSVIGTQLWGLYFLAVWSVAQAAGRLNNGS